MYKFLLHYFGKYGISDKHRLLIFLDERSSSYSLYDLKALLNREIRQRYGRNADVIRNVEPICSHKSEILQIADILMGAIGYHYNGWHQHSEASAAKIELANYIAVKAGLSGLAQDTPEEQEQFEIRNLTVFR